MRIFAEEPQATQQAISPKTSDVAYSRDANPLFRLQRASGHHADQRSLQSNSEERHADSTSASSRFGHDFSRISIFSPAPIQVQTKLMVHSPGDVYEQEADFVAQKVMRMSGAQLQHDRAFGGGCSACRAERRGRAHKGLQIRRVPVGDSGKVAAPPGVHDVLRSSGQPLDSATQAFFAPRFGHDSGKVRQVGKDKAGRLMGHAPTDSGDHMDFSRVRVHTDTRAASSAQAIGALAYTAGNDIVFGVGQFAPETSQGQRLLAHELAHVVQQGKGVRRYRKKGAFNFGKMDDATLIEDSFDIKTDKETKPWIELVTVEFTSLKTDADGNKYSTGSASVHYHNNPAKFSDFSFTVAGGSRTLGKTDSGTFTVWRIEGMGYNSGSFSGTPGVDFDPAEREGPGKRYSKDLRGNMSFAVFYNRGEALHAGPLDFSSHGCVHVDWSDYSTIKQLNYHSVIGLTKVKVKYLSKEEQEARRIAEQVARERLQGADEYREGGHGVPAP